MENAPEYSIIFSLINRIYTEFQRTIKEEPNRPKAVKIGFVESHLKNQPLTYKIFQKAMRQTSQINEAGYHSSFKENCR